MNLTLRVLPWVLVLACTSGKTDTDDETTDDGSEATEATEGDSDSATDTDTDTEATEPDTDSDTVAGEAALLMLVNATCVDEELYFRGDIEGMPSSAKLFLIRNAGTTVDHWDETHTLTQVSATTGFDAAVQALLDVAVNAEAVMDGDSLFDCDDEDNLTFAMKLYDVNGKLQDCAIWGEAPEAVMDGLFTVNSASPISVGTEDFSACINFN